jgi:hypothetical protein
MTHIIGVGFIPAKNPVTKNIEITNSPSSSGSEVFLSTIDGTKGKISAKSTLYPKYKVISVIYAPPGHGSTVRYGQGDGWGTVSSISSSFSKETSLKVGIGNQFTMLNAGLGLGWSQEKTDENSISMEESEGHASTWQNNADGIDHDQDIIKIWLNPAVDITSTSSDQATWTLANNPGDPITAQAGADIVFLTVGQLMGRQPIDNDYLKERLQRAWSDGGALTGPGTDTDFFKIAQHDPYYALGNDAPANAFIPDPERFTLAKGPTINYGPSNAMTNISSYSVQNQTTNRNQAIFSRTNSVAATVGTNPLKLFSIAVGHSMTWTDRTTKANSDSKNTSADLNIMQPPPTWKGPTGVAVYTDNLYGTFLFTYIK